MLSKYVKISFSGNRDIHRIVYGRHGRIHRDNGPAILYQFSHHGWYKYGKLIKKC
jgi:hypothetical protein